MKKSDTMSGTFFSKPYCAYRLSFATGSILLYVIIFLFLHYAHPFRGLPIVAIIPVIVIAWLYGSLIGVIASGVSFPLNMLMLNIVAGISWDKNMLGPAGECFAGTIGLIFIALIVGRLSDLGQRLREELRAKQLIEEELMQNRESLEKLVNNKTHELQASQERFRAIAEHSPDSIIIIDINGIIRYCNSAAEKTFGYGHEEMLGQPHSILLPQRLREAEVNQMSAYIGAEGLSKLSNPAQTAIAVRKDGTEFPVEFPFFSWQIDDEIFFTAIMRDITQRKLAENELRKSHTYLENIFRASPDAIFVADGAGYIVMANESVYDVYGYHPEDIIGEHASIFARGDETAMQKSMNMLEELFETGIIRAYGDEHKRKDGSIVEIEASHVLLKNPDGSIAGSVSSARDITDRKRFEDQLRQSQKMEAIGTLAGGIAHDFNNILAAIMGYTELSKNLAAGNSALERNLSQVLKSVDRAKALVCQILAFSRKTEGVVNPLRLHLIIEEALKLLRASLPSTISIRSDIDDTDDVVVADATEIYQIMMNLCTNAAYAMQTTGGVIEVMLKPIDLGTRAAGYYVGIAPGPYVLLSVKDTGMGIPRDVIGRIFEPFFTTKGVGKGTGMGLAMVHGIVKSLKGDIKVYSAPGKGAVFHTVLPRVQAEEIQWPIAQRETPQGTESVLLVDDEAVLLDVGEQILSSLGYRVTALSDAVEACEVFGKNPAAFDLVITDQTMPQFTGYELAQRLMEIRTDIPIILCTGYSDLVTAETALAGGIKAFVIKPLNRLAIAETIRRALGERAA